MVVGFHYILLTQIKLCDHNIIILHKPTIWSKRILSMSEKINIIITSQWLFNNSGHILLFN